MTVIPFPLWLVERRGEIVQGPSAKVIVLPVIRVERAEKVEPKKLPRKRRAKR
ncbi:MAG: hypothetical protein IPK23_15060 [Rhizobiales bacterium]|nr:hypothetical protein [Hyphomicrobiales bacterium]